MPISFSTTHCTVWPARALPSHCCGKRRLFWPCWSGYLTKKPARWPWICAPIAKVSFIFVALLFLFVLCITSICVVLISEQHILKLAVHSFLCFVSFFLDAWVFQPPIEPEIIAKLDFYMGLPKCDNRIVTVFQRHNYTVLDPAFAVHALELDSIVRTQPLYGTKNAVVGDTDTLLLSDQFMF